MARFGEECAVFGVYGSKQAALHVALGLHALQHRGQEATGIVALDGDTLHSHHGIGMVGKHFGAKSSNLNKLIGNAAIGHNRYATCGGGEMANIQPFTCHLTQGRAEFHINDLAKSNGHDKTPANANGKLSHGESFALAHNGNLKNAETIRQALTARGTKLSTTSDTEVIIHLLGEATAKSHPHRLAQAMQPMTGAYSLVGLSKQGLLAMRDPLGMRPLVLGKLGTAWVVASETCGFDMIGADYVRDVAPGEVLLINNAGVKSTFPFTRQQQRFCIFEYIYFARPDSVMENRHVYRVRKQIGAELAREAPVAADLVVPVPDSGVPAALGYAEEAKLSFDFGIIRSHYVGRSFIQPTDQGRQNSVKLKHNVNRPCVAGKRVILVDDSIVRGTTAMRIVSAVRAAGASEVHMRIASPPTTHPCFYGVDTPSQENLIAARLGMDTENIARHIGSDSLAFLSLDGMYRALGEVGRASGNPQFCDACFSGDYPDEDSSDSMSTARQHATPSHAIMVGEE